MTNQNNVVVDKHQKTAVVTDVVIMRDSNIRKKEHKTLERGKMLGVKATVLPEVINARGCHHQPKWIAPAVIRKSILDLHAEWSSALTRSCLLSDLW